jgi:LPS-assembly protein
VDYKNLVIRADHATYDDATGDITASGHVTLDGGAFDEHIECAHGEYNIRTDTGKFYAVVGTAGFRFKGKQITLTSSNPFAFSGKWVEKVGPERYIIHSGTITSCELPTPKWTFSGERIVLELGANAKIYNGIFRIRGVPVFYFPFALHPAEKLPRETGFLLPSYGTSNRKGFIFGDSFYWAINRSLDATFGGELWSTIGYAQHGQFRARPSETSDLQFNYYGVVDTRTNGAAGLSGQDIHLNGTNVFPHDVRGVVSLEYLSSLAFRQSFSTSFAQAINSEVQSDAFLSKNQNGFSMNLLGERYQDFLSTQRDNVVLIRHVPTLDVSSAERSFGSSRFFWSFDAEAGGLGRSDPNFNTDGLVGRFDVEPRLSYSLVTGGWTLRPEIALRDTVYTEQIVPGGIAGLTSGDPINRRAFEGSLELRPPALSRIFTHPVFHHVLKHTIEPRAVYTYVQGVDNFAHVIRFDQRDILSDTSQAEIGVINRLYGKPVPRNCPPAAAAQDNTTLNGVIGRPSTATRSDCKEQAARELLSWELGQEFYFNRSFGGALIPGQVNTFSATEDFTGIDFLTDPRRLSPIISRLKIHPTLSSNIEWALDYDTRKGRINASTTFVDFHFHEIFLSAGHTFLHNPAAVLAGAVIPAPSVFNQFRLSAGYGNANKRGFSTASSVGFDASLHFIQYSAVQTTYNWDCCGVTVEYRRLALGALRNENEFRFAFALANVGSFGNLKRTEKLY